MAKYSTSMKRNDVFFMNFDARQLAKKIEEAGKSIKPAMEAATRRSLPLIQKDFEGFAAQHDRTGMMGDSLIDASQVELIWGKNAKKRFVGKTKKGVKGFSGGSVKVVSEEEVLFFEYGFDAEVGGIRALWLDVGTPKRPPRKKGGNTGVIKPSHFIYYAVENNLGKIHDIQKEELTKIVEGLK